MAESNNSSSDYISPETIKGVFLNIFSLFATFISFLFSSIKHYFLLIILFVIAGLLSAYAYYSFSPSYYKTEMIVQHNELTRKTYHGIIEGLNNLIASESYSKLATELKIPESSARKIGLVEAVSINNEPLAKDTSTKKIQSFKINVLLSDNTIIDTLQFALVKYINSTPFLHNLKEGQKKIYSEQLSYIEKELERLDTLKEKYNRYLLTSKISATFYNNDFDPAGIYKQSIKLSNQKEAILEWFNHESEAISVIDGFKTPSSPQSEKLRDILLIGLLSGFLTGFFVALILSLKKLTK
jgi:uncharacterized protein involved in exopolysaccharide biosynthesis